MWSLPLRGAWIEIWEAANHRKIGGSLPLRGAWIEIEMKIYKILLLLSLPLRGAWIEMDYINISTPKGGRRSPYGERGLKYMIKGLSIGLGGRSPYGERGLKSLHRCENTYDHRSLPLRGAWIEIT